MKSKNRIRDFHIFLRYSLKFVFKQKTRDVNKLETSESRIKRNKWSLLLLISRLKIHSNSLADPQSDYLLLVFIAQLSSSRSNYFVNSEFRLKIYCIVN